jgi:transposase
MKIDKANIEQFIREKVEIDSLTDAQIARLLNVGTSTISHWRNKFNIRPADKFKRKFKEKYGSDALQSFDMMVKNRTTLQEIANYFGFTREYARQVYNKLYNGYTATIYVNGDTGRASACFPAMVEGEGAFASSLLRCSPRPQDTFFLPLCPTGPVGFEPIDFGNKVRYSLCRSETLSYLKPFMYEKKCRSRDSHRTLFAEPDSRASHG